MTITQHLVDWAASECARQQSGELSVARMIEATTLFNDSEDVEWIPLILEIATIIEPSKNENGFRVQPITISTTQEVRPVLDFERLLTNLCDAASEMWISPEEFYQEFEQLHPFNDGNGRLGAILYNYFLGKDSESLVVPPPFKVKA